ncbi:hypothetical protein ACVRXF_10010 [Streptococcus orisasini]
MSDTKSVSSFYRQPLSGGLPYPFTGTGGQIGSISLFYDLTSDIQIRSVFSYYVLT